MEKSQLKHLIDVAAGREAADLCIKNCNIIDVYNKDTFRGDVYITDGLFAGFGGPDFPEAKKTVDAGGQYMAPGFINGHVHIESSHLSPAEFARLVVPHGTTTVIADPHEICNVCGIAGLDYMLKASEDLPLTVYLQIPSCVPSTPFENSGAVLLAKDIATRMDNPRILGLGELMNYVGTANADSDVLDKIMVAKNAGKVVDGHAPAIQGAYLDAYSASGVCNDHECATGEELRDRIRRGMYVLIRQGSACHDERNLLKGVDKHNADRCLFCTDDRQPKSLVEEGDIDNNIRIALSEGFDAPTAVAIASLNAAQCYGLKDRGAIAPGLRADFVLVDNLEDFNVNDVYFAGRLVASNGEYLAPSVHVDPVGVSGCMNVKGFSPARLALKLSGNSVRTIDIIPGSVVTEEGRAVVSVKDGVWVRNEQDVVKIAVVERHKGTGNVGLGLIRNYGLKGGAVATSVAHDSHNIIVVGDSDADMSVAVEKLVELGGGIVVVKGGKVLDFIQHEIAGLMTDKPGSYVEEKISSMQALARKELGINDNVDPFMTLCFMALPVIPAIKITDMGLFDVTKFAFTPIEV